MSNLEDIGEFGLIERLTKGLKRSKQLKVGIGDDCAVFQLGDEQLLLSCDALIEGVHFRRDWASPEDIGHKAAAAALSDIAAMGGRALCMLLTLACPQNTDVAWLERLYQGVKALAESEHVAIAGGDTTASPDALMLDVTVVGVVTAHRPLCRSGTRPGDLIAITGYPGCSTLGLKALERGVDAPSHLREAHLRPRPKLLEGRYLADYPEVRAMIDVSDGLVQDLGHLARAGGVRINIETMRLPLHDDLVACAADMGLNPVDCALFGGEDYYLAFSMAPEQAEAMLEEVRRQLVLPVTVIGEASAGAPGVTVDGKKVVPGGYNHFQCPK